MDATLWEHPIIERAVTESPGQRSWPSEAPNPPPSVKLQVLCDQAVFSWLTASPKPVSISARSYGLQSIYCFQMTPEQPDLFDKVQQPGRPLPRYRRWVFDVLLKKLKSGLAPAVVLRGARQVGKTTLQEQMIEYLQREEKVEPSSCHRT